MTSVGPVVPEIEPVGVNPLVRGTPSRLHAKAGDDVPLKAATLNTTVLPLATDCEDGCTKITGIALTPIRIVKLKVSAT
jgi:hypothetical protein